MSYGAIQIQSLANCNSLLERLYLTVRRGHQGFDGMSLESLRTPDMPYGLSATASIGAVTVTIG